MSEDDVMAAIDKENARIKRGGGPAFPEAIAIGAAGDVYPGTAGMSLRQYYAGQALSGMLAHATRYHPRIGHPDDWHKAIAIEAAEIADALIAELEK